MSTHALTTTLIVLAIIVFVIVRQLRPRKLSRFSFIGMPIIALIAASQNLPHPTIPPIEVLECAVTIVVGIACGAVQAFFTRVFEQDGEWYAQGGWPYLATWVVLIAVRLLISLIFGLVAHVSMHTTWIIWVDIAAAWGMRAFVLYLRHPHLGAVIARSNSRRL